MSQDPQRLGDYLLVEQIGEGGMAEVFRAEVVGPTSSPSGPVGTVVIKRIRPELHSQPEFGIFRQMFWNEARLVARLNHANLARVFALNEAPDPRTGAVVPFIVGEFVQGRELWALLRTATKGFSGTGIPPGVAAYITREMARGLGHAHAHRDADSGRPAPIIHRDVSPENIMISDEGQVKVIDFGVAKALGGFGPQTRTGIIKGKLAYMAPEQVAQRAVPATDVFGAGIVLYEMLTGRRLFGGQNEFLVVQRVLKAAIPPPSARVAMPKELDEIVMRALDRDLNRRYRDGDALADALTEALERVPALHGANCKALLAWMREVEGHPLEGPPERDQGSDLHVDVDEALRAVEGAKGETQNLESDDLIFGPMEGTVDPGVHGAVTQAMRTMTPEALARELGASGKLAVITRPQPVVEPLPSSTSPVSGPYSGRFGSDREVTAFLAPQAPPSLPTWAKALIWSLVVLVLVLTGLLLGLSHGL